jgi:GTP cyclohydrolase III
MPRAGAANGGRYLEDYVWMLVRQKIEVLTPKARGLVLVVRFDNQILVVAGFVVKGDKKKGRMGGHGAVSFSVCVSTARKISSASALVGQGTP